MNVAIRFGIFGVLLAALCVADGNGAAQDFKKLKSKTPTTTNNRPLTAENLNDPLVPPDILAKCNLNATQKPMADKVIQEFNAKNKDLVAKVPASAMPASATKGKFDFKGKGKGGAGTVLPAELTAVLMNRVEYEKKFEEILTEAQKKTYDELLARRAEALLSKGK